MSLRQTALYPYLQLKYTAFPVPKMFSRLHPLLHLPSPPLTITIHTLVVNVLTASGQDVPAPTISSQPTVTSLATCDPPLVFNIFHTFSSESRSDDIQPLYGEDWPSSTLPSSPISHGTSFLSFHDSDPTPCSSPLKLLFSKLDQLENQMLDLQAANVTQKSLSSKYNCSLKKIMMSFSCTSPPTK